MLHQMFENMINWLMPQSCFLCGHTANLALCEPCLQRLPYIQQYCQRCGSEMPKTCQLCGNCQQDLPPYTQTKAIFNYIYPIKKLIHAAKFERNLAILHCLGIKMGEQLTDYMLSESLLPDVLIPIPLHPQRLRERGYNQSLELAKLIAKQTHIPLDYTACQRIRNTPHQSVLSSIQRRHNLKNAFMLNKLPVNWQYVILVDDVVTTGSTVKEVTQLFLRAGIARVDVWCCARSQAN